MEEHKEHSEDEHKTHEHIHPPIEHKPVQSAKASTWAWVFGVLSVLLVIALVASMATNGFSGSSGIPQNDAKEKVIDYVSKLLQGQTVNVTSMKDNGDLYQLTLVIAGRPYDSYMTKDGKLLFPNAIDMTQEITPTEDGTEEPPQEIAKSDKPIFQMFVMSECPYGVMAEDAFFPVLKAMNGKFDFELHFIATDNGDGTFTSLHGQKEVDEDLRQVCVMKEYPENYIDYIDCQNKNYLVQKDLSTTWGECLKKNGMDQDVINKCAGGSEGKDLLKENIKLSDEKNIGGSPTILINGGQYSSARTAQAFQKSICSAYNKAPDECNTVINATSTAAPEGGC